MLTKDISSAGREVKVDASNVESVEERRVVDQGIPRRQQVHESYSSKSGMSVI